MKQVTVVKGDTLWDIAKRELGDPMLWRKIYSRNLQIISKEQNKQGRRHMHGPDWIFPGTVLEV